MTRAGGRLSGRSLFFFWAAVFISLGAVTEETDPLDPCREAFAEAPSLWESARCFHSQARTPKVVETARRELNLLRGQYPNLGTLPMAQGYFEEDRFVRLREESSFEAARELFTIAVEKYAAAGDSLGEIRGLNSICRLYRAAGRLEEAETPVARSLEIASSSSDPAVKLEAELVAADHSEATGIGIGRSFESLMAAYSAFPDPNLEQPDPDALRMHRRALNQLSVHASRLGRSERQLEISRLLALVSRASGSRVNELRAKYSIAGAYVSLYERGEETREAAIEAYSVVVQETGNLAVDVIPLSHLRLGQLLGGKEGLYHLKKCQEIAQSWDAPLEAACYFALAEWELSEDPREALTLLKSGLKLMENSREPYRVLRVWPAFLRSAWATRTPSEALKVSLEVLDAIEAQWLLQQQDSEGGEYASVGFLSAWAEAYHWLAGKLLTVANQEAGGEFLGLAFEVSERMRGRVLLDALNLSAIAPETSVGKKALAQERKANLELVGRLKTSLWAMTVPPSPGEDPGLSPTVLAYENVAHPEIVELKEIQGLLGESQALLSFQFLNDPDVYGRFTGGSWVMVVHRNGVETVRLPSARALRSQLRFFRSSVASGNEDAGRAEWLYDQLLAEALEALPPEVDDLILVPDGELYGLPFSALRSAGDPRPLGARYSLSIVPSATLWSRWTAAAGDPLPAAVMAFADPDQDHAPDVIDSLAKKPAPLPRARREGRRVTRLFGGASHLVVGKDASEDFLRSADLSPFGLLHFATHTVVDHENPYRSAVILTAGTRGQDGLVRPAEIADLELENRLVVLSACDTASGEILRGEGVMGLGRAFFVAGARTVVGTLWPVEDGDAERFFDGFYDRLFEGQSVSEAVRGTQEELWRQGVPAQAWAGIAVMGDGGLTLPAGKRSGPVHWWWISALLLLITTVFWLRLRARARSPG